MAITKDILNLIKNITENDISSLEENARLARVSERNIRYKIKDCNYYLNALELPELNIKLGNINFDSNLEEVVKKLRESISVYSFSQEEREKIELTLYLFEKNQMTLEEISDFLGISIVTLNSDLKRLRKYLATYFLSLESENNKALILKGKEENKRKLILDILLKNYDLDFKEEKIIFSKSYYYGYFIPWDKMDDYFKEEKISLVKNILENLIRDTKKKISDKTYKILFFCLLITFSREKTYPLKNIKNEKFLSNTKEYEILKNNLNNYNLSKFEILALSEYFLGTSTFSEDNIFYGNWVQIETFVMNLIKEVSFYGYLGLEKDISLIEGLINHIKPAIYRSKIGDNLDTCIYEEFKESYPMILSQIENAWKKCEFQDLEFSNEELAYIAMHFQLAIKRLKKKEIKNLLIVCGAGYSTSKFLAENIKEKFSANIIDIIPYNALDNYNLLNEVDLIITTISKLEHPDLPIIKVSPVLNKEDIKNLEELNISKYKNKIRLSKLLKITKETSTKLDEEKFISKVKEVFKNDILDDRELNLSLSFMEMLEVSRIEKLKKINSWEDGIRRGSKKLMDENLVDGTYTEGIIDLINKFGSYMVIKDGIILAHAKNEGNVKKTGVGLLVLDEAIEFPEEEKVRLIITLASRDQKEHLNGLMEFINILRDINLLESLKDIESPQEIYTQMKNLFK